MGLVEQALGIEPLLELFKGNLEVPNPIRNNRGAIELICAITGIDPETAAYKHSHPVLWPESKLYCAAAEHHALQTALLVLQRKVMMTGGVDLVIREFPLDTQVPKSKIGFQQ